VQLTFVVIAQKDACLRGFAHAQGCIRAGADNRLVHAAQGTATNRQIFEVERLQTRNAGSVKRDARKMTTQSTTVTREPLVCGQMKKRLAQNHAP
jgi:hypothetical protein